MGRLQVIRSGTDSDIGPVLRMAQAMWAEAPAYRTLRLDMDAVAALAYRLVGEGGLLVAQSKPPEAETVGFMAVVMGKHLWTAAREATELALYVTPEARGAGYGRALIAAGRAYAGRQGARWLNAGTSLGAGEDTAVGAYLAEGFVHAGVSLRLML